MHDYLGALTTKCPFVTAVRKLLKFVQTWDVNESDVDAMYPGQVVLDLRVFPNKTFAGGCRLSPLRQRNWVTRRFQLISLPRVRSSSDWVLSYPKFESPHRPPVYQLRHYKKELASSIKTSRGEFMRNAARLKMGYYPLAWRNPASLSSFLLTNQLPRSTRAPTGRHGSSRSMEAPVRLYGVELDAERARIASSKDIETIQGNAFDAVAKPESFSLLYLNPPYDSEIGSIANRRMEGGVSRTYVPLAGDGRCSSFGDPVRTTARLHWHPELALHQQASFRVTDPDSIRYRQIAIFGVRHEVRGAAVESNKRQLQCFGLYGNFLKVPELQPGACSPYSVPPSDEASLSYRGLPYDLLEDLLPHSGAWRQAAPLLMPQDDIATGRPITAVA